MKQKIVWGIVDQKLTKSESKINSMVNMKLLTIKPRPVMMNDLSVG